MVRSLSLLRDYSFRVYHTTFHLEPWLLLSPYSVANIGHIEYAASLTVDVEGKNSMPRIIRGC